MEKENSSKGDSYKFETVNTGDLAHFGPTYITSQEKSEQVDTKLKNTDVLLENLANSVREQNEKLVEVLVETLDEIKNIASQETASEESKNKIEGLLLTIAKMAPEILEVILKTLANPLLGLGTVAEKIRKKAMEESSQ